MNKHPRTLAKLSEINNKKVKKRVEPLVLFNYNFLMDLLKAENGRFAWHLQPGRTCV